MNRILGLEYWNKVMDSVSGNTVIDAAVDPVSNTTGIDAAVDSVSNNTIFGLVQDSVSVNGASMEQLQQNFEQDLNALQKWLEAFPDRLLSFGIKFVVAFLILFVGGKLISLIRKILKKSLVRTNVETGVAQFLDSMVKVALYVILVIWIASYFGFETTSLIAMVGSAGVAIALALQGSLSNITGGILILLLKPFRVGDYIIEDNKGNEGVVTEIQLFYTKLRTVDDRIVILPNGTLANTSLTNLNLTPLRRLIMNVGISYSSDVAKAKEMIHKMLQEEPLVRKDEPIDIYVQGLDASQVTIGYRFYCKNEDYFELKWRLTEKLKETLDREGIEIPYSQLDVTIRKSES